VFRENLTENNKKVHKNEHIFPTPKNEAATLCVDPAEPAAVDEVKMTINQPHVCLYYLRARFLSLSLSLSLSRALSLSLSARTFGQTSQSRRHSTLRRKSTTLSHGLLHANSNQIKQIQGMMGGQGVGVTGEAQGGDPGERGRFGRGIQLRLM
jgi:hypothetical protein